MQNLKTFQKNTCKSADDFILHLNLIMFSLRAEKPQSTAKSRKTQNIHAYTQANRQIQTIMSPNQQDDHT